MDALKPAATLAYVTAPDRETALSIGRALVAEGLAACVNVLPAMVSVYRWRGEIETAEEAVLIVKLPADGFPAARARILALHPYEVPCVLQLPVSDGHAPYLAWLAARGG